MSQENRLPEDWSQTNHQMHDSCKMQDSYQMLFLLLAPALSDSKMLDVQNLYKPSSPQQPIIKRRRLRLSSVPLVDLRSTSLPGTSAECEEVEARLIGSPRTFSHLLMHTHSKSGICSTAESMENPRGMASGKIQHLTHAWDGQSRFPKLDECAHFHYEFVELGSIQVNLYDVTQENIKTLPISEHEKGEYFSVQVTSSSKIWVVRRTYENFRLLDEQLHRCIYDRKFSLLSELPEEIQVSEGENRQDILQAVLTEYLERFSAIAGNLINCGPILNWLELDNRGNHLIVADDSAINTPAVAAAYVTKRYTAQASDEISFEVGDMISVIDMPPPEESIWWRGKKGFEVGFFPCECVEIIGDKVPHSINIPKAPTKPVLRKHGKLISFFRSFILSRPSRRKLKQSGILKERVFGCDLGEHLLNSGHEIPMVLTCCAEFIEEHGIVDGIYRLSGITSNIQKLRLAFDEDRVPNLNDAAILQDIHCVASLLKMYFRELPNPLLTYQLYDRFVFAVQSEENNRLINMRDVVQQLPPPHYRTLEYLVKHLAKVASHGAETGMTPKNVAIVWAPNLLRSKELEIGSVAALQVVGIQAIVTEFLIRYVDLIFNEKLPSFSTSLGADGTPKKSRPKSLAISTPTKLLSLEEARSRALNVNVLSQPKYIEVGGGPANLPSKYHTIIELPARKRGNVKLKKSPSGWKSFFSKGKSQYSKEKPKVAHSPGHSPAGSNIENNFNEVDSSIPNGRNLRSVKSAESLTSTVNNINRISDRSSKIVAFDNSFKMVTSQVNETETKLHSSIKFSPHSHVRSISHDSYFETSPEAEAEMRNFPVKSTKKDLEESSSCLEMDDFEDVATDINHIHINYDSDFDFISTGTNEIAEIIEPLNDKASRTQIDIINSECLTKSPKKYRWKGSESISPKSKLSLKEKFKQTFGSPSLARKIYSSSSESSEESSIKGSLKRTPSYTKDSIQPEAVIERLSFKAAEMIEDGNMKQETSGSPSHSPKMKQPKWTNVLETSADVTKIETSDNKIGPNWSPPISDNTSENIVVERYGSEKTVIVEVHASQFNEQQETHTGSDKFCNEICTDDHFNSNTLTSASCHSSLQGECGSVASVSATISESGVMNLSIGEMLEMNENGLSKDQFEQTSPETESQYNSTISTPTSATKDNVFEVMDTDMLATCSNNFSAEIISSFHVDDTMIDTDPTKVCFLPCIDISVPDGEETYSNHSRTKENKYSDSEYIDHQHSTNILELDKFPCSPSDKFDSETSTPSIDTSGEGKEGPTIEDRQKNAFGYIKLIDEFDFGSTEEDAQLLLKSVISDERNGDDLGDNSDTIKSPCSAIDMEENQSSVKSPDDSSRKYEMDTSSTASDLSGSLLHTDCDKTLTCTKDVKNSKDSTNSIPSSLSSLLYIPSKTPEEDKKSPSQETKLSDLPSPERFPFCSNYLSPLDESKRRFESEIGRDILHERKMRLELEKIQLEQKLEKISPGANDSRNVVHSLLSPVNIKNSYLSKSNFPKEISNDNEDFSVSLKDKVKKNDRIVSPGDFYGVELRNAKDMLPVEEIKRKSEPSSVGGNESVLLVQNKRHSEPQLGSTSQRHTKLEKKTSIKELMSKFENESCSNLKTTSLSKTNIPRIYDHSDIEHEDKSLVSVKMPSSSVVTNENKKTENKINLGNDISQENQSSVEASPPLSCLFHKEDDDYKKAVCHDQNSLDRLVKKEKLALRLSAPCDLSIASHSKRESPKTGDSEAGSKNEDCLLKDTESGVSLLTSDLSAIARRERIDKYKEERRAQLREKIRSESFRLDREDKKDFLSKIKQKPISPIKSDDQILSLKPKNQPQNLPESKLSHKTLKQTMTGAEICSSSTNITDSIQPLYYLENDKKNNVHSTGNTIQVSRLNLGSSGSESDEVFPCEPLQTSVSSFLRTVPGRRSLRTGSESEAIILRHSLPLKNNSRNPERVKTRERVVARESIPSVQVNLPLQEQWVPSSEQKDICSASLRQLQTPLKERNRLLQERQRPVTKISPINRQFSLPQEIQAENSAAISPPNRIREVAAMFEKESGALSTESAGTKVKFSQIGHSAVTSAKARFLSQTSETSLDNEKDCTKRKASQYLSAV